MATRLPDNQEDREVYLREHGTTRFIEMIQDAGRQSIDVIMTVKAFAGEPEVLYVALEYAYHSGVDVTMTEQPPKSERSEGSVDGATSFSDLAGMGPPRLRDGEA
jgi:hypothetical protein